MFSLISSVHCVPRRGVVIVLESNIFRCIRDTVIMSPQTYPFRNNDLPIQFEIIDEFLGLPFAFRRYEVGMEKISCTILITALLLGCSGKGDEVAALVAAGSVLTAAQLAQSKGQLRQPGTTSNCNVFCGPCEVPCGNQCEPYGTLCYLPPGSACYGGQSADRGYNPQKSDDSDCGDGTANLLLVPIAH